MCTKTNLSLVFSYVFIFFLTYEMLERGFPIHPFQPCMEAEFSNNFFQVGSSFIVPSTEPWPFGILISWVLVKMSFLLTKLSFSVF